MLRLVIGLAIIATIFVRSPERNRGSLASDMAGLKERAQSELMSLAAGSPLAQSIAESALRRTLTDTTTPPPPRHDDQAATLARH